MELNGTSEQVVSAIVSVIVPAVALLALWLVGVFGGAAAVKSVQKAAAWLRPYVNDENDLIVITLDGVGELVLHRTLDAAQIARITDAVCAKLAGAPPREVAVGGAGK